MAGVTVGPGNAVFAKLLRELGWSVSRLVNEVNLEVSPGYVSRSTGSEWVNISRVPRQPLPTVIAHVLSQARGFVVPVGDLWPGVSVAAGWLPADHGTQMPWSVRSTKTLAQDWSVNGGTMFDSDRRSFMAISGGALTAPAWQYMEESGGRRAANELNLLTSTNASAQIPAGVVGMLRSTLDHLRRMDDVEGGGRQVLRIVHGEFRKVAGYVERGNFANSTVALQVLGVFGELAQLAGWVAYDAEQHGLAQRYFRTALQAAHSAGDRDLGVHVLGCMAYQTACRGQPGEAATLATAAVRAAKQAHPVVRSLIYSRLGHAQAAAGDVRGMRSSFEIARDCKSRSDGADAPDFLYWFGDDHLDLQHGQALQLLAFNSGTKLPALFDEADSFLLGRIDENAENMPRDSLFHSAWLARSQVFRGELEQAAHTTRRVMRGLRGVDSPRTVTILRRLDADLAARRSIDDLKDVKELRRELRSLIAT